MDDYIIFCNDKNRLKWIIGEEKIGILRWLIIYIEMVIYLIGDILIV